MRCGDSFTVTRRREPWPSWRTSCRMSNAAKSSGRGAPWSQRVCTARTRLRSSPFWRICAGATREHHRLSAVYQSAANGQVTKRQIDPYALVFRAGLWYLVGYCHLRHAPRTFRVDRIQKLTLVSKSFEMPEDFDIHRYLENEFREQPQFGHACALRPRRRILQEQSSDLGIHAGKRRWKYRGDTERPDLPWLASMTLGFANWVTVLDPPELREMVRDWAQATANLYASKEQK